MEQVIQVEVDQVVQLIRGRRGGNASSNGGMGGNGCSYLADGKNRYTTRWRSRTAAEELVTTEEKLVRVEMVDFWLSYQSQLTEMEFWMLVVLLEATVGLLQEVDLVVAVLIFSIRILVL